MIEIKHLILPYGWKKWTDNGEGDVGFVNNTGLGVLISFHVVYDGKLWTHFSVSRKDKIPSWEELVNTKEIFLGVDSTAIQVIPPRSKYVNVNPYVLHLWVLEGENLLPDFTRGTGQI